MQAYKYIITGKIAAWNLITVLTIASRGSYPELHDFRPPSHALYI